MTGQVDLRSRTSQPVFVEKLTQIGKQITRVRSNRYPIPRTDATSNRYTEFADRSTIRFRVGRDATIGPGDRFAPITPSGILADACSMRNVSSSILRC